jgi:hypothetical protein
VLLLDVDVGDSALAGDLSEGSLDSRSLLYKENKSLANIQQ